MPVRRAARAGTEPGPFGHQQPGVVGAAPGGAQVGAHGPVEVQRPAAPPGRAGDGQPVQGWPQPPGQLLDQLLGDPVDQAAELAEPGLRQRALEREHLLKQLDRGDHRVGVDRQQRVGPAFGGGPRQDLVADAAAEQRLQLLGPRPRGRERRLLAAGPAAARATPARAAAERRRA